MLLLATYNKAHYMLNANIEPNSPPASVVEIDLQNYRITDTHKAKNWSIGNKPHTIHCNCFMRKQLPIKYKYIKFNNTL